MTKLTEMINLKAAITGAVILTILSCFIAESAQASPFNRKRNRVNSGGSSGVSFKFQFSLFTERLENGVFVPINDDNTSEDIGIFQGSIENLLSEITFTNNSIDFPVGAGQKLSMGTLKAEKTTTESFDGIEYSIINPANNNPILSFFLSTQTINPADINPLINDIDFISNNGIFDEFSFATIFINGKSTSGVIGQPFKISQSEELIDNTKVPESSTTISILALGGLGLLLKRKANNKLQLEVANKA